MDLKQYEQRQAQFSFLGQVSLSMKWSCFTTFHNLQFSMDYLLYYFIHYWTCFVMSVIPGSVTHDMTKLETPTVSKSICSFNIPNNKQPKKPHISMLWRVQDTCFKIWECMRPIRLPRWPCFPCSQVSAQCLTLCGLPVGLHTVTVLDG